jgi:hypothetical protein
MAGVSIFVSTSCRPTPSPASRPCGPTPRCVPCGANGLAGFSNRRRWQRFRIWRTAGLRVRRSNSHAFPVGRACALCSASRVSGAQSRSKPRFSSGDEGGATPDARDADRDGRLSDCRSVDRDEVSRDSARIFVCNSPVPAIEPALVLLVLRGSAGPVESGVVRVYGSHTSEGRRCSLAGGR